jgi:MoaA/NifB/PqqE/SkfB family radical SAM enzyme
MKQQHMKQEIFGDILKCLAPGRHVVSLQGEGEPTVHPRFWELVRQVVDRGYVPYTITNGSLIDPELAHRYFPSLGLSLDTLDAGEAERIGRLRLDQAMARLDDLAARMGGQRIVIHTVDYGQDLASLKDFVKLRGFRHIVQPLQRKADYASRYPDRVPENTVTTSAGGLCRYLAAPLIRYFNIKGIEFPCVYIKDPTEYRGIDDLRKRMADGVVPAVCKGCAEIPKAPELRTVAWGALPRLN